MTVDVEATVAEALGYFRYYDEAYIRRHAATAEPCPQHPDRPNGMCAPCSREAERQKWEWDRAGHVVDANTELDRRLPALFECVLADHPDVLAWADRYQVNPATTGNLIIMGPTGTGKTHQAYGLLRHLIPACIRWRENPKTGDGYWRMPSWQAWSLAALSAAMRPNSGRDTAEVQAANLDASVLLLDDIGVARVTDWAEEWLFLLINGRYEARMPTVVTTNMNLTQLRDTLGARLASRLGADASVVVMQARDWRKQPAQRPAVCPVHGDDHEPRSGRAEPVRRMPTVRPFWEN